MFLKYFIVIFIVECEVIVFIFSMNPWVRVGYVRVGNVLGG